MTNLLVFVAVLLALGGWVAYWARKLTLVDRSTVD